MRGQARQDPRHLLDTQADQNIGNGSVIQPQGGPATVIPQANPERILMLSGPSNAGQTTSIALTASRIVGPNNPNPGFPGPITGVIEFGNGGQFTKVEVDIPIGPFVGNTTNPAPANEPQDGGVIVTVPTGVLRVYARYDNQLIQPELGLPVRSLAQALGATFIGPGGPVVLNSGGGPVTWPAEPVLVKAMAAYFSRHTSKVYRTNYCFVGDNSTGTPDATAIQAPRGVYCIPAFARSLKVLRTPYTAHLGVFLSDNMGHDMDFIDIPPSGGVTLTPIIPLIGTETIVRILSVNPAIDKISMLALCYEIGI